MATEVLTEKLYNVKQAAAMLGIHPNTLRNWTNAGTVASIRLPSGHRRFTVAQVEAIRAIMGLSPEQTAPGQYEAAA